MDIQFYYNTFAEERKQLIEQHSKQLDKLYKQHVAEVKGEIVHYLGLHVGEIEASMLLFGTCIFGTGLVKAHVLRFEEDAIYVIDTNGLEHNLLESTEIKMSLPSWVNVQWFCRTGRVKKVDHKIL